MLWSWILMRMLATIKHHNYNYHGHEHSCHNKLQGSAMRLMPCNSAHPKQVPPSASVQALLDAACYAVVIQRIDEIRDHGLRHRWWLAELAGWAGWPAELAGWGWLGLAGAGWGWLGLAGLLAGWGLLAGRLVSSCSPSVPSLVSCLCLFGVHAPVSYIYMYIYR